MTGRFIASVVFELLWWPLPSAQPFQFTVEWPAWGIPATLTAFDGADLTRAASRAEELWPRCRLGTGHSSR